MERPPARCALGEALATLALGSEAALSPKDEVTLLELVVIVARLEALMRR